jgi:exodeoxyribonuclease VII small subunit
MTKKLSFEEALARLEKIVEQLERGDIKLEEMLKSYEEGNQMINYCLSKLKEVEGKISKISGKDESDFKIEPFDDK